MRMTCMKMCARCYAVWKRVRREMGEPTNDGPKMKNDRYIKWIYLKQEEEANASIHLEWEEMRWARFALWPHAMRQQKRTIKNTLDPIKSILNLNVFHLIRNKVPEHDKYKIIDLEFCARARVCVNTFEVVRQSQLHSHASMQNIFELPSIAATSIFDTQPALFVYVRNVAKTLSCHLIFNQRSNGTVV